MKYVLNFPKVSLLPHIIVLVFWISLDRPVAGWKNEADRVKIEGFKGSVNGKRYCSTHLHVSATHSELVSNRYEKCKIPCSKNYCVRIRV